MSNMCPADDNGARVGCHNIDITELSLLASLVNIDTDFLVTGELSSRWYDRGAGQVAC